MLQIRNYLSSNGYLSFVELFRRQLLLAIQQPFRLRPDPGDGEAEKFSQKEFDETFYKKEHQLTEDTDALLKVLDEHSKQRYEENTKALNTVEQKGDWIMTFLAGLCGFAGLRISSIDSTSGLRVWWILGVASTVPGLLLCLRSRLPGLIGATVSVKNIVEAAEKYDGYPGMVSRWYQPHKAMEPSQRMRYIIIKSRASAAHSIQRLNEWKANNVRAAGYWLIAAFTFLMISTYLTPTKKTEQASPVLELIHLLLPPVLR